MAKSRTQHGDIRIGVSGWTYAPWRGNFYPKGLAQKRELGFAARQFNALEINGTFYGMQTPKAFRSWVEAVPPGFVFAVKGSRYLTHMLRLKAPADYGDGAVRPLRHAMEIRHESFRDAAFIDLLRRYGVALVCADTVDWPLLMDVTADFAYCRLHGSAELYKSGYSDAALDRWAERVRNWSLGAPTDGHFVTGPTDDGKKRDVFVFFDNTDKLMAPGDARGLMRRLGVVWEQDE